MEGPYGSRGGAVFVSFHAWKVIKKGVYGGKTKQSV